MTRITLCMVFILILSGYGCNTPPQGKDQGEVIITVSKKYLNLPVSQSTDRSKMIFEVDGKKELEFVIRLAPEKPDYWVFYDLSSYTGKDLKIKYEGNSTGLKKIYQEDQISGSDSLYLE